MNDAPESESASPGSTTPQASEGFNITREFNASPGSIFDAWTTPQQFSAWFGGAASEVPVETVSMDLRENGKWRATMFATPERHEIAWSGTYIEVDRPRRLVFTLTDVADDSGKRDDRDFAEPFGSLETVTVEFCSNDGRTTMFFHQAGGNLSREQYAQAEAGWRTFFDDLAVLVE
jgi:uncharacterized protein YndB with AHSA1/START domain